MKLSLKNQKIVWPGIIDYPWLIVIEWVFQALYYYFRKMGNGKKKHKNI